MSTVELDLITRRALALAAEDARGRGHRHLGTGHLLMGVLGTPDGAGARVLGRLGVALHDVDAEIVRVAGYGVRTATDGGSTQDEDVFGPPVANPERRWFRRRTPLPLSSSAEAALGCAEAAATAAVGTEHLVLGLLDDPGSLAHRILTIAGVTPDRLRSALQLAPPQ